jgi:hypothetical protein
MTVCRRLLYLKSIASTKSQAGGKRILKRDQVCGEDVVPLLDGVRRRHWRDMTRSTYLPERRLINPNPVFWLHSHRNNGKSMTA